MDDVLKKLQEYQKKRTFFRDFMKTFPNLSRRKSPTEYTKNKFYIILQDKNTNLYYILWYNKIGSIFLQINFTETSMSNNYIEIPCFHNRTDKTLDVHSFLQSIGFKYIRHSIPTTQIYLSYDHKDLIFFFLMLPIAPVMLLGHISETIGTFLIDLTQTIKNKIEDLLW